MYKSSQLQIDLQRFSRLPTSCSCSEAKYLYDPCGFIMTGGVSMVWTKKRDIMRKGRNTENLSHFHDTRTLVLSWPHENSMPNGGKKDVEVDTFPDLVKSIAGVLKRLHENFVIVPADKAHIYYTFVFKRCNGRFLVKELGLTFNADRWDHVSRGSQRQCYLYKFCNFRGPMKRHAIRKFRSWNNKFLVFFKTTLGIWWFCKVPKSRSSHCWTRSLHWQVTLKASNDVRWNFNIQQKHLVCLKIVSS